MFLKFDELQRKMRQLRPRTPKPYKQLQQLQSTRQKIEQNLHVLSSKFKYNFKKQQQMLLVKCQQILKKLNEQIKKVKAIISQKEVLKLIKQKNYQLTDLKNEKLVSCIQLADQFQYYKSDLTYLQQQYKQLQGDNLILLSQVQFIQNVKNNYQTKLQSNPNPNSKFITQGKQIQLSLPYKSPYKKSQNQITLSASSQSVIGKLKRLKEQFKQTQLQEKLYDHVKQFGKTPQALYNFLQEEQSKKIVYRLLCRVINT